MKSLYLYLAIGLTCWITALVQQPVSPLKSLVETEQAFSKAAEVQGTREAFAAFIADDGILYRPAAVNGKQWLKEHPLPPSSTRNLLAWQPIFARVSRAGDLGYTTGPWEYKDNIKDEKPSGYGNFVTVWKVQPDGTWKFVVDLGISHPMSAGPLKIWRVPDSELSVNAGKGTVNVEEERARLLERDRSFSAAVQTQTASSSYQAFAADDLRYFRNGSLPVVGKKAATEAIANNQEQLKWEPSGSDVSRSGDLGYTYGTYETAGGKKARGNYLHIWMKQGPTWQLVLDVTNSLPD